MPLDAGGSVSARSYRQAMRRWPSGVTVVTTILDGVPHGMTASAFTSVSVDPPMVLVVMDHRGRTHQLVRASGVFCVSVLEARQSLLSDRFAGRVGDREDRFAGIVTSAAATGSPVISGALAFLDCLVDQAVPAGDHTIFVGRVVACGAGDTGQPLAYYDRRYVTVVDLPRD